jgi:phage tail sheath protein FI
MSVQMVGGTDGDDEAGIALSVIAGGYDMFKDVTDTDISLVLAGKARDTDGVTHVNYLIDNLSEERKDCVVFASTPKNTVVNNSGNELNDMVTFANQLRPSSYGFLDSGYMYQYDKYNDIYRWVPLNGSVAGLAARTDETNDTWWSFAGLNRGQVKNVVKLAFNPSQIAQRDTLSKVSINSIVSSKGDGVYLFDDRTLLKKDSAFRAINVRRLFIALEKAIATDAKYMLFEFNDDFTRASFRNRVVPFLRDIQGRRGIYDFQVVCDETNNTPEVIAQEQFVGDIYIKPARAIRGIQLNFVAVRNSVDFSEVIGQF